MIFRYSLLLYLPVVHKLVQILQEHSFIIFSSYLSYFVNNFENASLQTLSAYPPNTSTVQQRLGSECQQDIWQSNQSSTHDLNDTASLEARPIQKLPAFPKLGLNERSSFLLVAHTAVSVQLTQSIWPSRFEIKCV